MSKVLCEREDLVAIADAIKRKNESNNMMRLDEMDNAILIMNSFKICTVLITNNTGYSITANYLGPEGYKSVGSEAFRYEFGAVKNSIFVIKFNSYLGTQSVSIASSGITMIENGIITHNSVRYIMFVVNDDATLNLSLSDVAEPT